MATPADVVPGPVAHGRYGTHVGGLRLVPPPGEISEMGHCDRTRRFTSRVAPMPSVKAEGSMDYH